MDLGAGKMKPSFILKMTTQDFLSQFVLQEISAYSESSLSTLLLYFCFTLATLGETMWKK